MGNRAETVRALLKSATIGSLEHVALLLVQALEDENKIVHRAVALVVVHPKPSCNVVSMEVERLDSVRHVHGQLLQE